MVLPPGAEVVELERNQVFVMAIPIESPDPGFPAGHLCPDDRVTVCSRFVVTADGRVAGVEQFDDMEGCEPVDSKRGAPFAEAVQVALQQWTFFAAATCRFLASEDECTEGRADVVAVPIQLAYRFEFSMGQDRQGRVSVRKTGSG